MLRPSPPSARTVDKSPFQQPLIKDLAGGGGCEPETNVQDALLLSALVFTESQAGIRFPPPPPRRGDKEPCAAALELGGGGEAEKSHQMERFSGVCKLGG